jgi:hypothetical protein
MDPIIGLIRAIANCDMPLEVYWLITVGSLVALHKLDVNAQAVRALAGLDPKLRPVNKSALLWKCATQVAIGHAEYDRACKLMQPAERPAADADGLAPAPRARAAPGSEEIKHGPQLGLGAKLGMPRMAFTAQELYAEGYSIGECDGANAFNEASRQKMLEAVRRECPLVLDGLLLILPSCADATGQVVCGAAQPGGSAEGGQVRLLESLSTA